MALAWQALRGADGSTAVLNAANEVAVAAFLDRRLPLHRHRRAGARCLDTVLPQADEVRSVEGLLSLDARTRRAAEACLVRA